MVAGMRIGGLAAAAVSAWLALQPGQPAPQGALSVDQSLGAEDSSLVYLPPVDAEVVDPFRPPEHVGAPGNRGLEYEPEPGQPVWASAEGEVVFSGLVAHNRFVTVLHRDGLRTAYGYLGWIAVDKGEWVAPGQLLGTASARFFFSVRDGDRYLDPAQVLTAGRVRLVPQREPDYGSQLPAYGSGG